MVEVNVPFIRDWPLQWYPERFAPEIIQKEHQVLGKSGII